MGLTSAGEVGANRSRLARYGDEAARLAQSLKWARFEWQARLVIGAWRAGITVGSVEGRLPRAVGKLMSVRYCRKSAAVPAFSLAEGAD